MHIYDCILLDDELDMLEERMAALEGVPGLVHVICESSVTPGGERKELHFQRERHNRFARWHGRWNHVIVEPHEIAGKTPAEREASLREHVLHGFHGDPHDILFSGDIRNIPDAGILEKIVRRKTSPGKGMRRRKDITAVSDLQGE